MPHDRRIRWSLAAWLMLSPLGPASAMLHANGEPLGPFDPRWPLYTGWLAQCGLPLRLTGCSGARLAG